MKLIILLLPLLILSCNTAEIAVNKESAASIKTVAILPFTSSVEIKKEILAESEEKFRSAFIKNNYKVVDDKKIQLLLENNKDASAGDAGGNIAKLMESSGADTILTGEITEYKEVMEEVQAYNTFIFGSRIFNNDRDEFKTKTFLKFQIILKLIKVQDGTTILTLKNRFEEAEKDDYLPGYISLDSYRRLTLDKIAIELIESLKKNR